MSGKVIAVIGMQYGSEGKGAVAELLGHTCDIAIRIGAPNAGHTIVYRGEKYAMRHIPCAWTNPSCMLMIGPAGMINQDVLMEEIKMVEKATGFPLAGRFFIHENVSVIEHRHEEAEREDDMYNRTGSTKEGIGAATADRVRRKAITIGTARECLGEIEKYFISHKDYLDLVHGIYDRGGTIMLEGTQGHGLSLYHGHYPHVTSRDTTASSLAGGCGIAPSMVTTVVGVLRTYPIRIAGNSGPLKYETNFDELGVEAERTTVTKKVRRIGRFDREMFIQAVKINRPNMLAITFMDYLPKENRLSFVRHIESISGVKVKYIGTGPDDYEVDGSLFETALGLKGVSQHGS